MRLFLSHNFPSRCWGTRKPPEADLSAIVSVCGSDPARRLPASESALANILTILNADKLASRDQGNKMLTKRREC